MRAVADIALTARYTVWKIGRMCSARSSRSSQLNAVDRPSGVAAANPLSSNERKARSAESLARWCDFTAARELLDALRETMGEAHYVQLGSACLAEAEWHFQQARIDETRIWIDSALLAFKRAKNKGEVLRCREMFARIDIREGEYSRARENFLLLLDYWRRLQRTDPDSFVEAARGQGRCLERLVAIASEHEQFAEGLKLGEKLLPLARAYDHDSLLARTLNVIGGIHFAMAARLHPVASEENHLTALQPSDLPIVREHCEQAMTLIAEAATVASRDGDEDMATMLGSNLGQLQVLLGRPLEALPAMHAFLSRNRKTGNTYMECDSLICIGWAQWAAGDFQYAENSLLDALELTSELTIADLAPMIHYNLSRVLEALHQPAAALQHYREYARLRMRTFRATQKATLSASSLATENGHEIAEAPQNEPRLLEPFYLKRAERFMATQLHANPGVVAIAADAGVSVRTLFAAFKKYRNTTPHAEILRLRLESAHADLHEATADITLVATIAEHWGFEDAGRFAKVYREHYGCTPSQTLRGLS